MKKDNTSPAVMTRLTATSAPASRQGGRVSMAKAWLSENYEIRVNLLDPSRAC